MLRPDFPSSARPSRRVDPTCFASTALSRASGRCAPPSPFLAFSLAARAQAHALRAASSCRRALVLCTRVPQHKTWRFTPYPRHVDFFVQACLPWSQAVAAPYALQWGVLDLAHELLELTHECGWYRVVAPALCAVPLLDAAVAAHHVSSPSSCCGRSQRARLHARRGRLIPGAFGLPVREESLLGLVAACASVGLADRARGVRPRPRHQEGAALYEQLLVACCADSCPSLLEQLRTRELLPTAEPDASSLVVLFANRGALVSVERSHPESLGLQPSHAAAYARRRVLGRAVVGGGEPQGQPDAPACRPPGWRLTGADERRGRSRGRGRWRVAEQSPSRSRRLRPVGRELGLTSSPRPTTLSSPVGRRRRALWRAADGGAHARRRRRRGACGHASRCEAASAATPRRPPRTRWRSWTRRWHVSRTRTAGGGAVRPRARVVVGGLNAERCRGTASRRGAGESGAQERVSWHARARGGGGGWRRAETSRLRGER